MARVKFDPESFKAQSELAKTGGDGDYPDIPKGIYLTEVILGEMKTSENGAELVKLRFKIDGEDEGFAGQLLFWQQCLVNNNGDQNEIGQRQTCLMLTKLSDGHFDVDDFINDPGLCLEKYIGTVVKVKTDPKRSGENNKFVDHNISILKVIESVYANDGEKAKSKDKFEAEEVEAPSAEAPAPEDTEDDIKAGMSIGVDDDNGSTWEGIVKSSLNDPEKGPMFLITRSNGKDELVRADQLVIYEEEEEEEVEEEAPKEIEVGSNVNATFNGEEFQGIVKRIEDGKAKIAYNGKLRPCKLENCSLV